ncbi:MAG: hypothetical protein ACQEST_11545 [Bacteroidota bacterium]
MKKVISVFVSVVLLVAAFVIINASDKSAANVDVSITEWEVRWEESRPRDPYVAPNGDVWFVGQRTHYVAEFDPDTEEFTNKFDLEDGAGPHTVIVDDEGTP